MSRPTIADVAVLAGVSKSTVSAVLNNKGAVKESTRRSVLRAMDELSYRPSPSARRGFQPLAAKSISFIVKEAQNPYYGEILAGIQEVAAQKGYVPYLSSSEGTYEIEKRIVEQGVEGEIGGLIITPIQNDEADLSHIYELKRSGTPFVLLEDVRGIRASMVDVDNVRGAAEAVEHLIELGHSRIAHFQGPGYSQHSQERVDGVRRAFSASHLGLDPALLVPVGDSPEAGYRAGLEFFGAKRAEPVTGVTCYNDLVALGLLKALGELGLRVPQDVSVVGFDDLQMLEFFPVPLTTVHVPKRQMGNRAAEMLIRQIESPRELPIERVSLEARLVVRGSTRRLDAPRPPAAARRGPVSGAHAL